MQPHAKSNSHRCCRGGRERGKGIAAAGDCQSGMAHICPKSAPGVGLAAGIYEKLDSHNDIRQGASETRTMPTLPAVGLDDGDDWSKTWEVPLSVEYWRMQMSQGDAICGQEIGAVDRRRIHPGMQPGRVGPLGRMDADMQLLGSGSAMHYRQDSGPIPADFHRQACIAHPPYLQEFSCEPAPHSQLQHQRQPWQSVEKKMVSPQNRPLRMLEPNMMVDDTDMQPQPIKQVSSVWNRSGATAICKATVLDKSFSTASGRESLEDEAGLRLLIKMAATRRPVTGRKQAAPAPSMRGSIKAGRRHPLAPLPFSLRRERTGARASSRAAQHGVEEVGGGLMLQPPTRDHANMLGVDAVSDSTSTASQVVARAGIHPRGNLHRPHTGLRDAGGRGRRLGEPLDAISCLRLGSVGGLSEGDGAFVEQGVARHIHGVEGEENPVNPFPAQGFGGVEVSVVSAPSSGPISRDGTHRAGPRRQEGPSPNRLQPVEPLVSASLSAMGKMASQPAASPSPTLQRMRLSAGPRVVDNIGGAGVDGDDEDEDGALPVGVAALLSSLTR